MSGHLVMMGADAAADDTVGRGPFKPSTPSPARPRPRRPDPGPDRPPSSSTVGRQTSNTFHAGCPHLTTPHLTSRHGVVVAGQHAGLGGVHGVGRARGAAAGGGDPAAAAGARARRGPAGGPGPAPGARPGGAGPVPAAQAPAGGGRGAGWGGWRGWPRPGGRPLPPRTPKRPPRAGAWRARAPRSAGPERRNARDAGGSGPSPPGRRRRTVHLASCTTEPPPLGPSPPLLPPGPSSPPGRAAVLTVLTVGAATLAGGQVGALEPGGRRAAAAVRPGAGRDAGGGPEHDHGERVRAGVPRGGPQSADGGLGERVRVAANAHVRGEEEETLLGEAGEQEGSSEGEALENF